MENKISSELVISKATDIVIAYLGVQTVEPDQLVRLVRDVCAALRSEDGQDIVAEPTTMPLSASKASQPAPEAPAARPLRVVADELRRPVSIEESVTRDHIICMEDGKPYRSLRRHLMAKYQLTPDDYRRKWGLPADYPMVAPSYAEQRSLVAKRSGLGTKALPDNVAAPKARTSKVAKG